MVSPMLSQILQTNITVIPPPWIHQPQVDLNILLPLIGVGGFILTAVLCCFAVEAGLVDLPP
jgi:hypothetical protein